MQFAKLPQKYVFKKPNFISLHKKKPQLANIRLAFFKLHRKNRINFNNKNAIRKTTTKTYL